MKNQKLNKRLFVVGIMIFALFILSIMVYRFMSYEEKLQLIIYDDTTKAVDEYGVEYKDSGISIVSSGFPGYDTRFNISKYPTFILINDDNNVLCVSNRVEFLNQFLNERKNRTWWELFKDGNGIR